MQLPEPLVQYGTELTSAGLVVGMMVSENGITRVCIGVALIPVIWLSRHIRAAEQKHRLLTELEQQARQQLIRRSRLGQSDHRYAAQAVRLPVE